MTRMAEEPEPTPRAEQAGDWCRRIAEGSLTDGEITAFEAWMADGAANRAAFDRATFIWRALDGRAAPQELVSIRMDALAALRTDDADQPTIGRPWYRRWPAAAAAMLVVMLVGSLYFMPVGAKSFETGVGERRVVMLDDGSRVSLDAASKVEVRYSGDRRSLELIAGRAKFDVAKNPLRPFSVTAGDKIIVATGTSFSVEMLNGKVDVVLYEGHVSVLDSRRDKPVPLSGGVGGIAADQLLIPGKELSLRATSPPVVATIDPGRSLSWEGGQLSFSDEPLGEAVERINRYSSAPIRVDDANVAKIPISGVFNAADTSTFVAGVTGVFPVKSEQKDGVTVLVSSERQK